MSNNREFKHEKKLVFRTLPAIALAFLIVSLTVNAAFLSSGQRKGVAVANGIYFSSNVLKRVDSESNLGFYNLAEHNNETTLAVEVKNYDSSLKPNPFDIIYNIKFRLSGNPGDVYKYYIAYKDKNNTDKKIEITSQSFTTISDFVLTGSKIDHDSFQIIYDRGSNTSNPAAAAKIQIIAEPTYPKVLESYILGSSISLTGNEVGYNATGAFDSSITEDSLSDMAGFTYRITTKGIIAYNTNPKVVLSWNAQVLELDVNNTYLQTGSVTYDNDADGNPITGNLTMKIDSGQNVLFSFFRTDDWTDIDFETLKSYVSCTTIE